VLCFEPDGFTRGDATNEPQCVERQILFVPKADDHELLRGNGIHGRRKKDGFSKLADELVAIAQRREKAVQMSIGILRRALIGVAGQLVFEQADDLEIRRLHVRADHFHREGDAKRFGGEDAFLWCCRRVSSQRAAQQTGASKCN
jgi:hypothetical protein